MKQKLDDILLGVQKPARYTGGEMNAIIKNPDEVKLRVAFCFPDTYEIGMSHLGIKILYSLINSRREYWCERCFMPLPDMEEAMRKDEIPLYTLESLHPVSKADVVAFTLQYELCYTTILAMLDLAGIPLLRSERESLAADDLNAFPIIIAGGCCTFNPAPLKDFIDIFSIGEGEEVTLELLDLLNECKENGSTLTEFYEKAALIEGVYVSRLSPFPKGIQVKKRIIKDLDTVFSPDSFVVPFIEAVHDRAVTEVLRGCIRGCRFCQAGFVFRPFRAKGIDRILSETKSLCETTGYDEISLCSLSTSDHPEIEPLLNALSDYTDKNLINLSLPSLRIDQFNEEVLTKIKGVRKSSLTFAPEAGTQRLRNVINKNLTEDEILNGCRVAFSGGYSSVKLYFMLGLPTETDEDIIAIHTLVTKIMRLYKECGPQRAISVSISLSTFVPKPFTPFQYEPMLSREEVCRRQKLLLSLFNPKSRKVKISTSNYDTSLLEAVFARGSEQLGKVILAAYKSGAKLDSWGEYFDFANWEKAFNTCKVDMVDTACRPRSYDEPLPWDDIDILVPKAFLTLENQKAHKAETTKNCRDGCGGCKMKECRNTARQS